MIDITEKFPKIKKNLPLAPLTAYKIGGDADYYYQVTKSKEIPELMEYAKKKNIPIFMLGGGCNVVFSDKGFRGLIIHNKANQVIIDEDNIVAESGALLSRIIIVAGQNKLGGITALIGLPGTIGGAIYGNAGAHGVEIGDFVEEVELFDFEKGVHNEKKAYFRFSYRSSILKKTNEIVLSVKLKLPPLNSKDFKNEILKFRSNNQPKGKVAGSFFKNPSQDRSAGYLIDRAGLKGLEAGDVRVSEKHANWLINKGNATQKQVIQLAKRIKNEVKKLYNIELKPENIIVDEHGNRIDI